MRRPEPVAVKASKLIRSPGLPMISSSLARGNEDDEPDGGGAERQDERLADALRAPVRPAPLLRRSAEEERAARAGVEEEALLLRLSAVVGRERDRADLR